VAQAIAAALQGPELSALQDMLARAHQRATEVLPTLHLPHIPTREAFLSEARAMFARTKSLDEIVDRAYELLLISVGTILAKPVESKS
jgi:stearoyl-CoA desaturase (Delta-9 desaturase)